MIVLVNFIFDSESADFKERFSYKGRTTEQCVIPEYWDFSRHQDVGLPNNLVPLHFNSTRELAKGINHHPELREHIH